MVRTPTEVGCSRLVCPGTARSANDGKPILERPSAPLAQGCGHVTTRCRLPRVRSPGRRTLDSSRRGFDVRRTTFRSRPRWTSWSSATVTLACRTRSSPRMVTAQFVSFAQYRRIRCRQANCYESRQGMPADSAGYRCPIRTNQRRPESRSRVESHRSRVGHDWPRRNRRQEVTLGAAPGFAILPGADVQYLRGRLRHQQLKLQSIANRIYSSRLEAVALQEVCRNQMIALRDMLDALYPGHYKITFGSRIIVGTSKCDLYGTGIVTLYYIDPQRYDLPSPAGK